MVEVETIQKMKELAAEVANLLDENKKLKEQLEEFQFNAILAKQKEINEKVFSDIDKLRERVDLLERINNGA
jgi:glutamine synthetase type III